VRKGRFLIVSWNGGGNFPPALALAARLAQRGHRVAIMADAAPVPGKVASDVAAAGAELLEYPSLEPWPTGVSLDDDPARFDELRNGVATANDVLSAAAGFSPDVLVVDCMSGAGLVAAELLGVPTAVLVHVLYQPFIAFWADLSVDMGRCREAFGLPALGSQAMWECCSRAGKVLVLVPQELDYPGAARTGSTHYVGPILDPRPPEPPSHLGFDHGDDRPLVLVSLSTTLQRQGEVLPRILEAVGSLPVRGLLTLGGLDLGELALPGNVVAHRYLPHARILPQVSAVVTHGGLSTITAALACGVPLVCIPQGREQPLNSARVAQCGAGIDLPADASVEAVAAALSALLSDPGFRAAAARLQAAIGRDGGGVTAVAHVEELLANP